ncbi:MAG: VWA domain-containing protein, partial [Planctomycetota bacterium]
AIPASLQELAPYDGVILSDVPAFRLSERVMTLLRNYVEQLGGGFLMIGGKNAFGVGGYYRTPIEEVLPVKIQAPDVEERHATALCLVLDRSGSMQGQKVEICKSAAIATVELLQGKDHVGVIAFDSQARWVVPMTRASQRNAIAGQIATITAGGGTNIYPGMTGAFQALQGVRAKIKHMIVLSDGHTNGAGYPALAAQIRSQNITVSTVAVGGQADVALLQSIADRGGGDHYHTFHPAAIPRIFTQDTMVHMGRLIREEAFRPRQIERHPMLKGWPAAGAPQLLGYVKTNRKATAQVPLVTDLDDPLLAHWRFGLGKATAFTSDCKSRWAALWITGWPEGYSQFWAQVLREMAREPQGRLMDIRLEERGAEARVVVDLLEDPAQFKNEAEIEADVNFVPADALGSAMRPLARLPLDQTGPGRYEGTFVPEEPGVYLVRARTAGSMVSAGLVHNVSGEAATGHVNVSLLEKACEITGGTLLRGSDDRLPPGRAGHSHFLELGPWLLRLLLVIFVADLAIRRWENVLGMGEALQGAWRALARRARR